jgi:hypothetical protein
MPEGDEFPAFGEGLMAFLRRPRPADADRLTELLSEFDGQVALANRQRRRRGR